MSAVGDARKRLSEPETALSRKNGSGVDSDASVALTGAVDAATIQARIDRAQYAWEWGSADELTMDLADDAGDLLAELDRLTAALAAERARVARVEALIETDMPYLVTFGGGMAGKTAVLIDQLRAALTTTAAPTTESKEGDHA